MVVIHDRVSECRTSFDPEILAHQERIVGSATPENGKLSTSLQPSTDGNSTDGLFWRAYDICIIWMFMLG